MRSPDQSPIGYVIKQYPRYSETFIVNEILAHEAAGVPIDIFSLRPPCDAHFQDAIARVRATVTYLRSDCVRATDFWSMLRQAAEQFPTVWSALAAIPPDSARDVWQASLLAQHVAQRGICHLHAHFANTSTTVAALAARMAGVTYSFTAHAKDVYGPDVRHDDLRRKLGEAAAAITVSDYNRDYLRRTYGAAADRVTRVYNGLLLDEFPYRSPDARAPRILAVGRLVEKKGLTDLVEACAILARAGTAFTCGIIGAGPLEATLREQIARLALEPHVELLGPRPRTEVVQHMQSAAVMAAPCVVSEDGDRDGLPTVLLEAMALGTPCVSTNVTGIPELVHDRFTGFLVPERSPRQLAETLDRLLQDVPLRVRTASAARALIERSFDQRRNAEQVRETFRAGTATELPAVVA